MSVVSLTALAILVWRADFGAMARPLVGARLDFLAGALLLALSVELCKTIRWLLLLDLDRSVLPRLLALVLTSRVVNSLAPMRAGDLWRVAAATGVEGRPVTVVAGSVAAEKLMDGVALGILTLLLLGSAAVSLTSALLIPILLVILLFLASPWARTRIRCAMYRVGFASRFRSLSYLKQRRRIVITTVLTCASIGIGITVNLCVLAALGISPHLMLGVTMLLSAYAAGLLPAAPGQIGVFELSVSGALIAAGLTPSSAVAAALALHIVLLAMVAAGGLFSIPLGYQFRGRITNSPKPSTALPTTCPGLIGLDTRSTGPATSSEDTRY